MSSGDMQSQTLPALVAPDPVADAWHIDLDNSDSLTSIMATAHAI